MSLVYPSYTIVKDGCVGQLLLVQQDSNSSRNNSEFNQILGFEPSLKLDYNLFKEKYNGLALKIITNVKEDLENYSSFNPSVLKLNSTVSELVELVKQHKSNNYTKETEIIMIHYKPPTSNHYSELANRRESLVFLDQFVESLSKEFNDLYLNILVSFGDVLDLCLVDSTQSSSSSSSWFEPPTQSYSFNEGKQVTPRFTSPMFAIYNHPTITRKDICSSFNVDEFLKGSNGKILLLQYLRELAFKLGKLPKYGA
eukprot:gene4641-5798_t